LENKALVLAFLATLCGIGILHVYMRTFEARVGGGAKHTVLVSTRDAQAGETLTRTMLGVRELPEAYMESRHVRARDIEKVIGSALQLPARANEALLWSDVAGAVEPMHTLSSLVREGMRAFTLHASDATFGELRPGDRVDVLLVTLEKDEHAPGRARTIMESLLVLAVDGKTDATGAQEDEGRHGASRVTLVLTNEQGQELAYAERTGTLRLLLRNPSDAALLNPPTSAQAAAGPGRSNGSARGTE
jgi:Flp pilus assembly protein CpaB